MKFINTRSFSPWLGLRKWFISHTNSHPTIEIKIQRPSYVLKLFPHSFQREEVADTQADKVTFVFKILGVDARFKCLSE